MPEFRVEGVTPSGKAVAGAITADNKKSARQRADEMGREKKFKVTGVYERATFLYRVQKGNDKPLDGEQKAYSKEEVHQALEKIGYKVVYVRKKLFGNKQTAAPR